MGIRNYVVIDDKRYPVDIRTARRGVAQPLVPRFAPGVKAFTGAVPPLESWGQQVWRGGMQQKYALFEDNEGWFSSFNLDPQWHDRLRLANSWGSPTTKTGVAEIRFARLPFRDILVSYSAQSKAVYTKSGSGAWNAATLPATAYTGFLCDTIAKIGSTVYLLLGTQDGYVVSFDGTTWAEVGRPAAGSDNFNNGIYCMTSFNSTLYLGGQNGADSQALIATYDGTSMTKKFQGYDLNAGSRVQTMLRRFVDSDNSPNQLHFTTLSSANGYYGQHFMYDGTDLRELQFWNDNAPLCSFEFNSAGTRALYFGMALRGSIWRFTGDYVEALRLDTPDNPYAYGIRSLAQEGRFLIFPMLDATNGLSLGRYDGGGWWQCEAIGTGSTGYAGEGASVAVYRERSYISLMHTDSKLFEKNTGSNYPTSGKLTTGMIDGDYRHVDKEWARVRVDHWPLSSGESVEVSYSIDNQSGSLAYVEKFETLARIRPNAGTAVVDLNNHLATVTGAGQVTYANKITGDLAANACVAYRGYASISLALYSLGYLIGTMTEASQANYDAIDTDDATAWNSTGGLLTQGLQIFELDLSAAHTPSSIGYTYKGWGHTSASTPGIGLSIWNVETQAWESLGTNSAVSASAAGDKIISGTISDITPYLDHNHHVFLVAASRSLGTFSVGADVNTQYIALTNSWSTAAHELHSRSLATGGGSVTQATLNVTKSGGSSFSYWMRTDDTFDWESCTPGTPLTFANPGTHLFYRIQMTGSASSPPIFTEVSVTYVQGTSGVVSLGSNSVVGSTETILWFGDGVTSKLLTLILTLGGGGSTTPSVFGLAVEYLVSPDPAEELRLELHLEEKFEYTDHATEDRSPAEMYDEILSLRGSKRRFAVTWVDGTEFSHVTFKEGFWDHLQRGANTDLGEEELRVLPLGLIVVRK